MNMYRKNTCACFVDRVGISRRYKRVHTANREPNGTNGDDKTISWWSFTDLALLPADEPLELLRWSRGGCQTCGLYVGEIGRMGRRGCGRALMGKEYDFA
jgi:hypothetical protein